VDRILGGLMDAGVPFVRVGSLRKIARRVLPHVLSARHGTAAAGAHRTPVGGKGG
jgi:hypothetical protein